MGGKTRPAYPAEYKQQIVERYASGRRIADLAKEFGCSEQSIATWVTRAGTLGALPDKGTGVRRTHKQVRAAAQSGALSSQERAELERLRKDVRRLQTERDILSKGEEEERTVRGTVRPTNALAARACMDRKGLRAHEGDPGRREENEACHDVPSARSKHERVLRVARPGAQCSRARERGASVVLRSVWNLSAC